MHTTLCEESGIPGLSIENGSKKKKASQHHLLLDKKQYY